MRHVTIPVQLLCATTFVVLAAAAIAAGAGTASVAQASGAVGAARVQVPSEGIETLTARSALARATRLKPRRGGAVRRVWPRRAGSGPRPPLLRWLSMQAGPDLTPARPSTDVRAASGKARDSRAAAVDTALSLDGPPKLLLVRSFSIPVDDPDAVRLENLAFTYDSALAAIAFVVSGQRGQAEQLLDQLMALQRTDGSIEYAYDTRTGDSSPLFRTGTHALIGIAANAYAKVYHSQRYSKLAGGVSTWLLARQSLTGTAATGYGLLRGGPDVTWVSTQHNLLARMFFIGYSTKTTDSAAIAANRIATGVQAALLVRSPGGTYFRQGLNDDVRALDAQSLGVMFLDERGLDTDARAVVASTNAQSRLTGRTITRSTVPAAFNNTYASVGPYTGYRPYARGVVDAPDVLWAEGTAQMMIANAAAGVSDRELSNSILAWTAYTSRIGRGPLGSDRTVTGNPHNEYHVWPTSASASWTFLALAGINPSLI